MMGQEPKPTPPVKMVKCRCGEEYNVNDTTEALKHIGSHRKPTPSQWKRK